MGEKEREMSGKQPAQRLVDLSGMGESQKREVFDEAVGQALRALPKLGAKLAEAERERQEKDAEKKAN
jgi:hypothetical protein